MIASYPVPAGPVPPTVAVVGSGPSGCYVAQMLRKHWPTAEITVFDRLPVPFGLLRYGVAPDHQHTKRLAYQFSRVFEDERTRFAGNVEVGRDVSLDELRANFHVVVLAAGISGDRTLDIPGYGLDCVYGAGQITRWVNAHPDEADFAPHLGEGTVIVGNGNVAVDVLRMLAKDESHFVGSDMHDAALARLGRSRPRRIHVVGRSAAAHAKFDVAMIRELADIDEVCFEVESLARDEPGGGANTRVEALLALAELPRPDARVTVSFHFGWSPAKIHGTNRVEAMSFVGGRDGTSTLTLPADSVVTAVGFIAEAGSALLDYSMASAAADPASGCLATGLYSSGWFRRGATGSIPANRACAKEVVGLISEDIDPGRLEPRPGYGGLSADLRAGSIDFRAWQQVDAVETAGADERRVRHKLRDMRSLLTAARGGGAETRKTDDDTNAVVPMSTST